MNDPKGSLWRKWDLHVHTPASYDYEYLGIDGTEKIIDTINDSAIEVFAITDHFTLDGYKKLRDSGRIGKIILPGIELKIEDSIVPSKHGKTQGSDIPINLQIIFDNSEDSLKSRSLSFHWNSKITMRIRIISQGKILLNWEWQRGNKHQMIRRIVKDVI